MTEAKHNNGLESLDEIDPKKWEIPQPLTFLPPRWMGEQYNGMEEDIAHDIYSAIFWTTLAKDVEEAEKLGNPAPDMNDVASRAREIAKTIMAAAEHASGVSDAAQRAFYAMVYKVKKNNLQQLDRNEYNTIEEWLTDRLEQLSPGSGELSDISFLMGEVFPMLEKVKSGYEPANLLSMSSYWSKTRAAIPYLRFITNRHKDKVHVVQHSLDKTVRRIEKLSEIQRSRLTTHPRYKRTEARIEELRTNLADLEEKHEQVVVEATAQWKEGVEKTLEVIADPDIKPWGKEGERTVKAALFRNDSPEIKIYGGLQGTMPGRTIFLVVLPSRYERTVESALGGLIEWKLTDPKAMSKTIDAAIKQNPFEDDANDEDCL